MRTQSTGQGRNSNAAAKLEHVAERFQTFYNDLEQEKQARRISIPAPNAMECSFVQQRRLSDNARFHQIQDAVSKLERNLESEARRRSEADKKLQSYFDNELRRMQDRLSNQIGEWQETVKTNVEGLTGDVAALQKTVREEKSERIVEIEDLTQSLATKVEECTVGLEDERVTRLEREAHTLKRIGEDIGRVQQKIEDESVQRDTDLLQIRNELAEVSSRASGESKFQSTLLEEMKSVRQSLKAETEARMTEDDAIINAINDYTKALQQGLRLVCQ